MPKASLTIEPLGRVIEFEPGVNLLQLLLQQQLPISYSCMAGRCATCRCHLRSGVEPAVEQAVLACQTTLTHSAVLRLEQTDDIIQHPARTVKAQVVALQSLNHDVMQLRLRTSKPLAYSPGQFARLQFANGLQRSYSMAGLSSDAELEFHIRKVPGGRVSGYVAEQLQLGDSIKLSGPMGASYLRTQHTGPMLCIAGGTGLAPILSIVRGALAAGMRNPVHIYFGVRSAQDVYGLHWLQALTREHSQIQLHLVPTQATLTPGFRAPGWVSDVAAQDHGDLQGWRAYLCGPPPMVDAAARMVGERGIPAAHIYADAFYAQDAELELAGVNV